MGRVKVVNIRALKDKLSAYLRDVRRGDVLLVTDRGEVVAEIRPPSLHSAAKDALTEKLEQMAARGEIKLGLPNDPSAYKPAVVSLPSDVVQEALDWTRGDR